MRITHRRIVLQAATGRGPNDDADPSLRITYISRMWSAVIP